jgi:hypothetical protein
VKSVSDPGITEPGGRIEDLLAGIYGTESLEHNRNSGSLTHLYRGVLVPGMNQRNVVSGGQRDRLCACSLMAAIRATT